MATWQKNQNLQIQNGKRPPSGPCVFNRTGGAAQWGGELKLRALRAYRPRAFHTGARSALSMGGRGEIKDEWLTARGQDQSISRRFWKLKVKLVQNTENPTTILNGANHKTASCRRHNYRQPLTVRAMFVFPFVRRLLASSSTTVQFAGSSVYRVIRRNPSIVYGRLAPVHGGRINTVQLREKRGGRRMEEGATRSSWDTATAGEMLQARVWTLYQPHHPPGGGIDHVWICGIDRWANIDRAANHWHSSDHFHHQWRLYLLRQTILTSAPWIIKILQNV